MKEHSIKSVRLTPTVKARLDTFKGSDTVSVCVDRMITFFEITGFNPRYASKNPTALVEKRGKRMEEMTGMWKNPHERRKNGSQKYRIQLLAEAKQS
jgi:hypothetical protein